MEKPILKAQVTKKVTVLVKGASFNTDLTQPFFAINWFNYARPWLYEIYLKFAVPIVEKIGARMYFKGKVHRVLEGPKEQAREMLVVVKYPGVPEFLKLFNNRKFKFYSLLRNSSVSRFKFGFKTNFANEQVVRQSHWEDDPQVAYLLHHFSASNDLESRVKQLIEKLEIRGVLVYFAGVKMAEIGREIEGKPAQYLNMFDGLLLFEASDPESMQALLNDNDHRAFRNGNTENFLAIFKRQA